jgi:EAL and modified HD-GYP domain-containing signal transduction protein
MLEEMVYEDQIKDADADSMFLFGLLSLIDSMMDTPMDQLLDQLPLPDKIKNGYIDGSSRYYQYLGFLKALEHSKPDVFEQLCCDLDFMPKQAAAAYLRSIVWTNEINMQMLA